MQLLVVNTATVHLVGVVLIDGLCERCFFQAITSDFGLMHQPENVTSS